LLKTPIVTNNQPINKNTLESCDLEKRFFVSVVLGVYGGMEWLPTTLKSILLQQDVDFEVVLVDDGNPEPIARQIRELASQDPRIRVVRQETNQGLTRALIVGCQAAAGDYIARIDNGDLMVPDNRLRLQLDEFQSDPEWVVCGGRLMVSDLLNREVYVSRRKTEDRPKMFAHVTTMFRKDAYQACGGYNPTFKTGQDIDLWPRLLSQGTAVNCDQVFAVAAMRSESISVNRNNQQIPAKVRQELTKFFASPIKRLDLPIRSLCLD
jgi:glycosyltransferase involved in cell wall biosynthesis